MTTEEDKAMTRKQILDRLRDVQQQMQNISMLAQHLIQKEQTYQKQMDYLYLQERQAGIGTEKVTDKGKLAFMMLTGVCLTFFLLIELLTRGFDPTTYVVLGVCIAVAVKYRGKKHWLKTLAILGLVGYTATAFGSIVKGLSTDFNWFYGLLIALALLVSFLITSVVVKVVNRITARHNQAVDAYNQEYVSQVDAENLRIEASNRQIRAECNHLLQQGRAMAQALKESCEGWYPQRYCDLTSVQFFIEAFEDLKVDTIKEAVNLYDTAEHRKRLENSLTSIDGKMSQVLHNQAEIGQLLETSNMLQMMNIMESTLTRETIRKESANIRSSIYNSTKR